MAYANLDKFDEACRCIGEAMTERETTRETWCEDEISRIAGEIALKSPEPDVEEPKLISNVPSQSHVSSRPNPGNCAPR
jgi:hypothetical protein